MKIDDYQELKETMIPAYRTMPDAYWKEHHIVSLIDKFPEGQVVIKIKEQVAGCALSIIVDYDTISDDHSYREVTADYSFDSHNMEGRIIWYRRSHKAGKGRIQKIGSSCWVNTMANATV